MAGFRKFFRRRFSKHQRELAEGIKSGNVRPEELSLDPNSHQIDLLEDRTKKPWYDILRFWKSVGERRQTTGFKVTRKEKSNSPEETLLSDHTHVPQYVSAAAQEKGHVSPVKQKQEVIDDGAESLKTPDDVPVLLPCSVPETVKGKDSEGFSNPETAFCLLAAALLMGEEEHGSPKAEQLDVDIGLGKTSREASTEEGSDLEAMLDAQKAIISDVGLSRQSGLGFIAGGRGMTGSVSRGSTEWHISAITIKDSQGVEHSEMSFYDTGCLPNVTTSKFASAHRLEERPLFSDDIVVYNSVTGSVTPSHYVELEMKDPKHGVKNFQLVSCLIVPELGGYGLGLGRQFMTENRVILDPTRGGDMYPVIARDGGAAAKGAQNRTYMQAVDLTARARAIKSGEAGSSSGTTTKVSGSSQGEKGASSRTSNSSSSGKKK